MPRADVALALALAALTVLLRIPFRARLLPTWDAVQFALALREYDVVRHQPHPPGYVLYVAAGHLLTPAFADPSQSFVWLSIFASAMTVFGVYRLAWALYDRATALAAAVGLAVSPLFWFYGLVGLPYAVEAALATGVAGLAWSMRPGGGGGAGAVLRSAVALGLAGGVRQSALVLLFPLWVLMAWGSGRRARLVLLGGGVMAFTVALWLVPMVWLTGGVARYVGAALELYDSTVRATTIVGPRGRWLGNLRGLGEALLMGLGLFLPALGGVVVRGVRSRPRWGLRERFFVAWIVPPLVVYAGLHFGQHGYLLTVLPALYILVARWLVTTVSRRPSWFLGSIVGGVALIHAAYFVGARPAEVPTPPLSGSVLDRWRVARGAFYRFTLWENTADGLHEREHVIRTYVDAVRREFGADDIAIVTELGNPRSYPWFRHATYYLPEFRVIHLRLAGFSPGYLTSDCLTSMATRPGFDIPLPAGTRRLVWMIDAWDPARPPPPGLEARPLAYGRWLYVLDLSPAGVQHGEYRLAPSPAPTAMTVESCRGAGDRP